jgi:hypothetical protein
LNRAGPGGSLTGETKTAVIGDFRAALIGIGVVHFTRATIALPLEMPAGRVGFVFALTGIL